MSEGEWYTVLYAVMVEAVWYSVSSVCGRLMVMRRRDGCRVQGVIAVRLL